MGEPTNAQRSAQRGSRRRVSRGLATVVIATALLFAVSAIFASSSTSKGALLGDAAVRGGARRSSRSVRRSSSSRAASTSPSPGAMSLAIVIVTHYRRRRRLQAPAGAGALALGRRDRRGDRQRLPGRRARAEPDRRHARHERAALCAPCSASPAASRARPPTAWREHRRRPHPRHPQLGLLRRRGVAVVTVVVKLTVGRPPLRGGRAQPAWRRWTSGLRGEAAPRRRLRLGPAPLLAGRRAPGRHRHAADGVPGRRVPAALGRGGGARRHVAARRPRQPRRHGGRRAVPDPARAVRAGPRRHVRRPHARRGGRARGRRRPLHAQLARHRPPTRPAPGRTRGSPT